jgi:hypothetical protein
VGENTLVIQDASHTDFMDAAQSQATTIRADL